MFFMTSLCRHTYSSFYLNDRIKSDMVISSILVFIKILTMGNTLTGSTSGIYATSCKKCKKFYVFGKVKAHGDFWQHWYLHKRLFLKSHKCEFGSFTSDDFSKPVVIKEINTDIDSYIKSNDPNLRAQLIAMEYKCSTIKYLKNFTLEYIDNKYPQRRILCEYDQDIKWRRIPLKLRKEIEDRIDSIFNDQIDTEVIFN